MAGEPEQIEHVTLHLYQGCYSTSLNLPGLVQYLRAIIPDLSVHGEFIHCHALRDAHNQQDNQVKLLAEKFARIKIIDPRQRSRDSEPLPGEIEYEKRRLLNITKQPCGVLYDGEKLLEIYNALLPETERGMHALHLVLTNQLFGTWNRDDLRYHARTSIYGIPCIISTTGLVEAPARSRTYYLTRQMGVSHEALEKHYQGQFLTHDDPRLTEVMKGYMLQALFYYLEGNPFCSDHNCRLYNAHWQHELIHAQLNAPYEFCPEHTAALNRLRPAAQLV